MKRRLPALIIAACVGAMASGMAQSPTPDTPPAQPPGQGQGQGQGKPGERLRDRMKEKFLENLDPETRQRFEAARQKALDDPAIKELRQKADAANMEFVKAMREKMQEIDPGLADIVKQMVGKNRQGGPGGMKGDGPGRGPGMGSLSDQERDKLMAAREKAKADPTVQAAEKKKDEAQNPQERMAAGDEYRKAMKAAMLKADPSLAPLLEKLEPPKAPVPQPPAPGGDGDNQMMEKK